MINVQCLALAAATLLQCTNAFDPSSRDACKDNKLCLQSFAWCDKNGKDCSFPENVYPMDYHNSAKFTPLLISEANYTLSWKNANPRHPVLVTFSIGKNEDKSSSLVEWQKNVTQGEKEYKFTFKDVANEFPTKESNLTSADILAALAETYGCNVAIAQPELRQNLTHGYLLPYDYSAPFTVVDSSVVPFLATQRKLGRKETTKKWRLGVGVGVGIGVPILLAASFIIGLFTGKRRNTKSGSMKDNVSKH